MTSGYRICGRCIMDTSDPEIVFDPGGICNHCADYFVRADRELFKGEEGRRKLSTLAQTIKAAGKGRDYDCLLGVSGGVDSTYLALLLSKLGLRTLAVHFDNGWDSELAVENVRRALDALKIDLITHVVNWEEFKDLQLSFLKASVPNCEIPTDHAINAVLFQTARKFRLKYIIGGGNVVSEAIMPKMWGYYSQDLRHLRAIHDRFGTKPLKTLPQISFIGWLRAVFVEGIRIIPVLNYVDYNRERAVAELEKEIGWRPYKGKHCESVYTRFFQAYILPRKFGFDKRRAHLSTLICSGQITREQALAEMQRDPYADYDLEQDRAYVIKKFGLTAGEFDGIMKTPVRFHGDYPSNSFFFDGPAALKDIFKRIATAR